MEKQTENDTIRVATCKTDSIVFCLYTKFPVLLKERGENVYSAAFWAFAAL